MLIGHKEMQEMLAVLLKKDRLPHGLLFYGVPGIGKYALAKSFAYYLERGGWPMDVGMPQENPSPLLDAFLVEPTNGTIGVDESRRVKAFLAQRPFVSKYRVVVIRDAELLTGEAQNALLKIAEEPPLYGLILFTTREVELLSPTLVSRLRAYYVAPVSHKEIENWLSSEWEVKKNEAKELAERAFGRPGLALAYLKDESFRARLGLAEKFLSTSPASRKEFLKFLLEPEDFNLKEFLDALLLVLAREKKESAKLWHSVIELRHTLDSFALNPRIQLSSLWTISRN